MPAIATFEDIQAWQKGRELTREIYSLTGQGAFSEDPALKDQLRRASVSIISNIAEGFERDGDKEFVHFLSIAKASAGEVRAQLYVALDVGFVTQRDFERLRGLCGDVIRLVAGFMGYLSASPFRGKKLKEGAAPGVEI